MRLLLSLVLVLAALVLAACGGSNTTVVQTTTTQAPASTSPAATAKSKADYIAQADRICSTARAKLNPLNDQLNALGIQSTTSVADDRKAASLFEQQAQISSDELRQLESLTPPPGDEAVLQRAFDSEHQIISLASSLADALRSLNASKVDTYVAQIKEANAQAKGIAQGYGFKVCGSD